MKDIWKFLRSSLLLLLYSSCLMTGINSQTKQEVSDYLQQIGVKHDSIVLKQACLETGWFKSYNCRERHNLFGATNPKTGKYYWFNTWQESCDWYKRWQDKWYKKGDYYNFLNCTRKDWKGMCLRYAEDPNYTDKLKKLKL